RPAGTGGVVARKFHQGAGLAKNIAARKDRCWGSRAGILRDQFDSPPGDDEEFASFVPGGINDLIVSEMLNRRKGAYGLQFDKLERLAKGKEIALHHSWEVARVVQAAGKVQDFYPENSPFQSTESPVILCHERAGIPFSTVSLVHPDILLS